MSNDLPAQDVKRQVSIGADSSIQLHGLTPLVQQVLSASVDTTFASDMAPIQGMHVQFIGKKT